MEHVLTPVLWLMLFVILLVSELMTMGLTTVWFAIGALAGLGVNLAGGGFWPQIITFIAVSILTLLITRPFAIKYINKGHVKTNVNEIPGTEAIVIEEINNLKNTGRVMLRGTDWRAVAEDGKITIPKDAVVVVQRVEGVKVIVKTKEAV